MRKPSFALLLGLAWLLAVGQLLSQNWAAMAETFPDADDAMRLVQVRDFLAGQGWFDLHQTRLNPPFGYDSHWSRLIDAGLVALFVFFNLFVDQSRAELLMSATWPLLWLIPVIGSAAAVAWRLGGRQAALISLLLAAFAIPGFQQFRPGRIDHHNIHIALTLLAAAATGWSDRKRWCAYAAGAIAGLALAVGFEALAFHALFGACFALRYIVDRAAAAELRAYGTALAASTLAAFLFTVGPGHWGESVCDMIAINSAGAIVTAGIGLVGAATFASSSAWARFAACAASAAAALLVFTFFEPRCLAGPFGLIDPAIRTIWLDNVSEATPLSRIWQAGRITAIAMASFPLVALLALLALGRNSERRRDFGFLVAAAALLLSAIIMIGAVRAYSYAIWLGVPFVASALIAFVEWKIRRATSQAALVLVAQVVLALLVTPTAVTAGVIMAAHAIGVEGLLELDNPERQACVRKENYDWLARLPRGLIVVNALEWTPYLLAWTPHPVLAGPYHRMPAGMIASHQALAFPPAQARDVIRRVGVRYVVTCGSHGPEGLTDDEHAASLWKRLESGESVVWLERLPQSQAQAFTVYRVK